MEENCINCLYSNNSESTILIDDLLDKYGNSKHMICKHINSPYYEELVNEKNSCRLFINAVEYFKMKDRKENIEELKRKMKFKK